MLGRPNALDRLVDAIPAHDLVSRSPLDLMDPARAAAAAHLEQVHIPLWIITIALQIAILAWFWNTGRSALLRDRLRARLGSEFIVRFAFGALLALLDRLVALAPQAAEYRFVRLMDLTQLLFRTWLLEWIVGTLVAMLVAGIIAAAVLSLADRTHQWYLYTIAAVIGGALLFTYAVPLATSQRTASLPRATIAQLQQQTGMDVTIVAQHVAGTTRSDAAYVSGWGNTARIVITDTLLAGAGRDEVRFAVARGYAWIRANDGLHVALVQGAFLVLGTALAVFVSDRIGFRRDDDPVARLALLGAIMGGVYLIALPFYNGYARNVQLLMDESALLITRDRVAAIRYEVRTQDQELIPACPNPFAYWYLMDTPAPGQRIAAFQGRPDPCATQRR